ncbi:MAG: hypothetical protein WA110_07390, partial [Anaerolineaceae bacterium]
MEKLFGNSGKHCLNIPFWRAQNQCTPYENQNRQGVLFCGAHRSAWEFWQHYLNIPIAFAQMKRASNCLVRLYEIGFASRYL